MRLNLTTLTSVMLASCLALSACNSTPKNTYSPSLQDLVNKKSLDKADRENILKAAHERSEKELALGNGRAAYHFAEIAERFAPEDYDTQLLLGRTLIAQKKYEEALVRFKRINEQKQKPETLEYQGLAEYFTKRIGAAQNSLEQAISMDDSLWQSAAILGRIYRADRNYSGSDEIFKKAFEHAPDDAPVFDHQGYAFLADNQWSDAVRSFEKAQSLSNNKTGFHSAYRVAKAKSGDMAGALTLASDVESAQLFVDLAKIAMNEGERVEAVQLLKRAKATSPQYNAEIEQLLTAAIAMKS